jgi:hypothetical protein
MVAMVTYAQEPVQVYLRREQLESLQVLAQARAVPVDELIRQGVDALLIQEQTADTALDEYPGLRDLLLTAGPPDEDIPEWPEDRPIEEHPLWGVVGLGASGVSDLATAHDRYLAEYELGRSQR